MTPPTTGTAGAPLAGLRRDDGAVLVPATIAGEVLRLLARALLDDARAYGGTPSPTARALLDALYQAAHHQPDNEPDPAAPVGPVATVTETAARMGCSTRWVRALLAAGRLPGHRTAAGVWLVHVTAVPTSEADRDAA